MMRCLFFRVALNVLALVLGISASAEGNDLLILYGNPSAVLRYNGSTGALLGQFALVNNGYAMTYGPDGNLYVATTSNVSRYDGQTGAFLNVFVPPTSNLLEPRPTDMTFCPDGNLYVSGTNINSNLGGV